MISNWFCFNCSQEAPLNCRFFLIMSHGESFSDMFEEKTIEDMHHM